MKETLRTQEGKKDPIVQLLKHLLIDEKNKVKNKETDVSWIVKYFDANKVHWIELKLRESRVSWKQLWTWLLVLHPTTPPPALFSAIGSPSCWQPCCSSVRDSDDEISAQLSVSSPHPSWLLSLLLSSSDAAQSSPPPAGETGRPSITDHTHTNGHRLQHGATHGSTHSSDNGPHWSNWPSIIL